MDKVLSYVRSKQGDIVDLIRQLVECESPTDDSEAVGRFVRLVADSVSGFAEVRTVPGGEFGPHLQCIFDSPREQQVEQILVLGHSDTVWPIGTLETMPCRESKGRLWGPGVLDMKSGIAFFIFAMRALHDLGLAVHHRVVFQINSDEEVGSPSSRPLTEEEAKRSSAVLVLEPGEGLDGKLKTARKGFGAYTIRVQGKASHAGVDFEGGASAIVELARQIDVIAGFTDPQQGITVNPGTIAGGVRPNVVAAEAVAEVDFRFWKASEASLIDEKLRQLSAFDKRCTISVEGGVFRPAMERSPETGRLFDKAKSLAHDIGVKLGESTSGGNSDGNFTAALGVPTLDGLGGVGEGPHAVHESILLDRIADRTALMAKLLLALP